MFWILLGLGLLLLIYFTLVKPLLHWQRNGVPQEQFWITCFQYGKVQGGSRVHLFQGLIQYRNVAEAIDIVYKEFRNNRYYGVYQFLSPTLVIKDPDLINQIIVKDFEHFVDHFNFFPEITDPLWHKTLFFLKGEKWRHMRTMLSPSFTGSKMKSMFGLMSDCAKQFVQYFRNQGPDIIAVELKDIFTRFTNDVIATTAFGVTCDSMTNKDNEFYLMGKDATQFGGGFWGGLKFFLTLVFPKLSKTLGISILKQHANKFFLDVIKSNIQSREKDGIIRPDMIHLLLEARKKSKNEKNIEGSNDTTENINECVSERMTDEDIAAQAFIFFLAGFDSVATLMYFMAYELALSPNIQERLINEVDDIRSERGESLNYEDLGKMKYMDMVVSETLRKWPSTIILDRTCVTPSIQPLNKDEKAIHIKVGDLIWFPQFSIHRDPQFYSNPDRFDPERFSEENKANVNPYAYLPFGGGPRACIANRFALMETKLVFFYLLSKFEFTVIEKTPIPLKLKKLFQLDAEGGFWLGLKPRKKTC